MKAMRAWPLLVVALLSGCALNKMGKDLGDGLMQAVNDSSASIGKNIVKGAGDGLRDDVLNDVTRGKLADTVRTVEAAALEPLPAARDRLLGDEKTREELKAIIEVLLKSVDEQSRRTSRGLLAEAGKGLREDVLNEATRAQLNTMLVELSTTARSQGNQMRDEMLGEATQRHVDVLVRGAMSAVVDGTDRIRNQAHEELSFVQKNAAETFLVVGGVAAIVVLVVWRQKEKNRLLLQLLTKQIHDMSDAPAYQASMERLQKQAELMGLHNQLEDALVLQGMVTTRGKGKAKKKAPEQN